MGVFFAFKDMPNQGSGINRLALANFTVDSGWIWALMALGILFKLLGGRSVVSPFM